MWYHKMYERWAQYFLFTITVSAFQIAHWASGFRAIERFLACTIADFTSQPAPIPFYIIDTYFTHIHTLPPHLSHRWIAGISTSFIQTIRNSASFLWFWLQNKSVSAHIGYKIFFKNYHPLIITRYVKELFAKLLFYLKLLRFRQLRTVYCFTDFNAKTCKTLK